MSARELASLQHALHMAPSSFGLQPYRALFVRDPQLRAQLRRASFDQPQITEASCLVVIAIETRIDEAFVERHFAHHAQVTEAPLTGRLGLYRDSVMRSVQRMSEAEKRSWATHQAYLALGFLLFAAAQLGIDANPMEGFSARRYDELLQLEREDLGAVVIAGLGHRSADDRLQHTPKVRRPLADSIREV